MQIETEMIAASVMCWMRYAKQFDMVGREVGLFSADVLGYSGKEIVEVEIKVSLSDLKNERTNKKHKHEVYAGTKPTKHYDRDIPHRFYIAVSEQLKEETIKFVTELNPSYGVLVLEGTPLKDIPEWESWKRLKMVKRTKALHDRQPTEAFKTAFAKRMSSDLCRMHLHRQMHKDYVRMAIDVSKKMENHQSIEAPPQLRK